MARKMSEVKKTAAEKPKEKAPRKTAVEKESSKPSVPRRSDANGKDITVIFLVLLGIFVCFAIYTPLLSTFGAWIKGLFTSTFGSVAYLVPPAIISIALYIGKTKTAGRYGAKYWAILFLVAACACFWHSIVFKEYSIYAASRIAKMKIAGGFIGGMFAKPICNFMGQFGAILFFFSCIVAFTLAAFDLTLKMVCSKIAKCAVKVTDVTLSFFNETIRFKGHDASSRRAMQDNNADLYDEQNVLPDKEGYTRTDTKSDVEPTPAVYAPESKLPKKLTATIIPGVIQTIDKSESWRVVPEIKAPEKEVKNFNPAVAIPFNKTIIGDKKLPATPIESSPNTILPDLNIISEEQNTASGAPSTPAKQSIEPYKVPENDTYILPSKEILNPPVAIKMEERMTMLESTAKKLIETLESFGIKASISDYSMGPTVTRYELQPEAGVRISRIVTLSDDIAMHLAAVGVRIEAPIPGKSAIGIEIPSETASNVNIKEVIDTDSYNSFKSKLAFALGKDISGMPVVTDIARMPHLLIAGATGSGKSVCINTLIASLLFKSRPDEVKLILIDPKQVELKAYNGIPHLLIPVVTDAHKAAGALAWAVKEMTNRYKIFAQQNARDIKAYNSIMGKNHEPKMPQIVIIIDELADLMMVAPSDVEDSICRLAQLARAAGMHLVIATQRPSVNVITGTIKANIPSRIAFAVSSQIDSRTILDYAGAEKLIGRGDMLYAPIGVNKPIRVQGAFVSDDEIERIVEYVKSQGDSEYDDSIAEEVEKFEVTSSKKANRRFEDGEENEWDGAKMDDLLPQAIDMAIEANQASVAMYQRKLKVGYQRAAKLIDQMEALGIIGKYEGTKPRQILVTRQQYLEMQANGMIAVNS